MLFLRPNERKEYARILKKQFSSYSLDGFECIAVEEACIQFWESEKKTGTQDSKAAMKVYIYKAAKHIILNEIRRVKKMDSFDDESKNLQNSLTLRDNNFEHRELNRILTMDLLSKLSENKTNVIRMHYLEGLTIAEIATRISLSDDGVKKRLKEALRDLRILGQK